MAGILDSLSSMMTPDAVGQISKAIGVDTPSLNQGLGVAAPTVLGSLARTADTPDGASSLLNMLPKDTSGDLIGNLISSVTGGAGGTQADVMQSMLGSGVNAIGGTLSQKLGFDVRPILTMAVPMVAGLLSKTVKEQNLDASGIANMLKGERDTFMNDPANREVAGVVSSALEAGDQATALRKTFDDTEWMKVRMAPVAALYLIGTASPSGSSGTLKELEAAVAAVDESVKRAAPTSLIGTAFGGGLTKAELDQLGKDAPPNDRILGVIREGLAMVVQKSPADAQAYRDMVMNVAQRSAEAAKEGGFLGIGGTLVSKEEQRALDEINTALTLQRER